MAEPAKKKCFIIGPIGAEGSDTRKRSDQILKYIIVPVAEQLGYEAQRADKISEPGIITTQIIERLFNDDLVIADLTDMNPNVYYELAVRHMVKKPIVQIMQDKQALPFDVSTTRTVKFNYQDLESVANCKDELVKQIKAVEKDPTKVDSPITQAAIMQGLSVSSDPVAKSNEEILSLLRMIVLRTEQLNDIKALTLFQATILDILSKRFQTGFNSSTASKLSSQIDPEFYEFANNLKSYVEGIKTLKEKSIDA
jgi:hypothetical protein